MDQLVDMFGMGMNPPIKMWQAEWFIKDGARKLEKIDPLNDKNKDLKGIKIGSKIVRHVGNKKREFVLVKKSSPRERFTILHFEEV